MAKRQKINYNGDALAKNLKQSNGKGVDAFFTEQASATASVQTIELPHAQGDVDMHARMHAPTDEPDHADVDAETDAQIGTRTHARMPSDEVLKPLKDEKDQIDDIRKRVSAKRHLSSFTFRFRANELEELDLVVDELNQDDEHRVSKNDAIRTALNWLLDDYKQRKVDSVLARVLTDT